VKDHPAFLRKLRVREHAVGWATPCPDVHASSGFSVLIRPDEPAGRYRFECVEAAEGDPCSTEWQLVKLLGLEEMELGLNGSRATGRLEAILLSEIGMRSIRWEEKPLWQRSAFQLLAGPKGAGKGTYLAGLGARVTQRGRNVLFVASEDSREIDLKPRLVAAGADERRVSVVKQHLQLPRDIADLRELALEIGNVGLLVIDPVANHIGNRKTSDDGEVRAAISPLNELADDLDCLLIGVRHPGKDRSRGAVASVLGSTAWVDVPRAVVMIAADDEDEHLRHIQVVVGNRSLNGNGRMFRIEGVLVDGLEEPITVAVDLGESAKSVDELIARDRRDAARVSGEQLRAMILRKLASGEKSREYLDTVAKDELGANPDSVYKSGLEPLRKERRIRAFKTGMVGGWYWTLMEEQE